MWITIEQIQCLQAVKDFGSINGASQSLNKAKSAVSYSIKRLDEQLGFATLNRDHYRIALTLKGEAFLGKAKPLLKELAQLKEEVQKIASGVETKMAMSASAIFPNDTLHKVLYKIMQDFPSTEFTFHREILSGEKMLLDDLVDIAIFENLQNKLDLEFKQLDGVSLKLVICADHPFLKLPKKQQTMQSLTQFPHIIQRSTLKDDNTMGIPDESIRWTVSDIESKKELILNNLGWGRLPSHFIEKELKQKKIVHLKKLNYDHQVDFFLCKKKDKAFGPVLKHIWDSF